jgi:acid stress chaperone HdeB
VTVFGQSLALTAKAETQSNVSTFNMETVTCKELMLAGSDDRELMMSLFHGFFNGKKNETLIDADRLAKITDEIENYCADNPKKTLISVFEEYRGSSR